MKVNSKLIEIAEKFKDEDVYDIGLKLKQLNIEEKKIILNYINAWKKLKIKIPSWAGKTLNFPSKLSLEQSSSEATAKYKASLYNGKLMHDMTCGFGIDSYFFSENFNQVKSIEANTNLAEIVKSNFKTLEKSNIDVINNDSSEYLKSTNLHFDLIYADPDRRPDSKNTAFRLENASPNIILLWETMLEKADNILIKCSPMADIHYLVNSLSHVYKISVVAVDNECKEVLVHASKNFQNDYFIELVDLHENNVENKLEFNWDDELKADLKTSNTGNYIYELPKSWTKAGLSKLPCKWFSLKKISANTNWYFSDDLIENFYGKKYEVLKSYIFKNKALKKVFKKKKFNIKTKNFPYSINEIKNLLGVEEGGSEFLFFYTNQDKQLITLHARKA